MTSVCNKLSRRQLMAASLAIGVSASTDNFGRANQTGHATMITDQTRKSIGRGLRYLSSQQNNDGTFGRSNYERNVGVCSLAGMAFISSGSTAARGPFGQQIDRCLDYVLASCQRSGFISPQELQDQRPMYGHGFGTLFLAENHGMANRDDLRAKLGAAVRLIIETQNAQGGWRYNPRREEADVSVTACQVVALRAARNVGVYVPANTIEKSIQFIQRCQNKDGGFMYQLSGGQSEFARTAAAVTALRAAGESDSTALKNAMSYLADFSPKKLSSTPIPYFYYGIYYAAQAIWQDGHQQWNSWFPLMREILLARQDEKSGAWNDKTNVEYATAMATIILQMPYGYLPIFER